MYCMSLVAVHCIAVFWMADCIVTDGKYSIEITKYRNAMECKVMCCDLLWCPLTICDPRCKGNVAVNLVIHTTRWNVPQLGVQDLVAQGVPAREARWMLDIAWTLDLTWRGRSPKTCQFGGEHANEDYDLVFLSFFGFLVWV